MPGSSGNAEGQGDRLSRGDLKLERRALRNDWPISQKRKATLISRCFDLLAPAKDGGGPKPRLVLAVVRTIGLLAELNARQAAIDLAAEKVSGREQGGPGLADLVAEAEARAEARKTERKKDRRK